MSKKKYRIAYESKFYDVNETMEILKNCPPDVFFKVYHKYKKEMHPSMNNHQTALNQVVDMIKRLDSKVDTGFKQVNDRIDNLTDDFNSFKQDINARLDYIVKANNLKDNK